MKKHKRIAAFVSAMTLAVTMAGSMIPTAVSTGIALTAYAMSEGDTVSIPVKNFQLRQRDGGNDQITVYQVNADGTEKPVQGFSAGTEMTEAKFIYHDECTYYAKRTYGGNVKPEVYYDYNDVKNKWVRRDRTVTITIDDYSLENHTFTDPSGNVVPTTDSVTVTSTALNTDRTKETVCSLFGNSVESSVSFEADLKYAYMLSVERGKTAAYSKSEGAKAVYTLDTDLLEWRFYGATGAVTTVSSDTTVGAQINKATFNMLDFPGANVQSIEIYDDGELINTVDADTFERGSASFISERSMFSYSPFSWKAIVTRDIDTGYGVNHLTQTIQGAFVPTVLDDGRKMLRPYVNKVDTESVYENKTPELDSETPVDIPNDASDEELDEIKKKLGADWQDDYDKVSNFFENYNIDQKESETDEPVVRILTEEEKDAESPEATLQNVDITGHGAAYLLANGVPVERYTAGDLDNGYYRIDTATYSPDVYDFHLKVATDSTEKDFYYFKWDETLKIWRYRCNTAETPTTDINVDMGSFNLVALMSEHDFSGSYRFSNKALNTDRLEEIADSASEIQSFTKADFMGGDYIIKDVPTNPNGAYYFTFETEPFMSGTLENVVGMRYIVVGVDLVPLTGYGSIRETAVYWASVPSTAKAGDIVTVTGTTAAGDDVKYTLKPELSNNVLPIPAGEYTIADNTSGYKDNVTIGDGIADTNANGKVNGTGAVTVLNLKQPIIEGSYKVTDLKGDVVDEGVMKKRKIEAITDLGLSANKLSAAGAYTTFESKYGIANSIEEADFSAEDGFLGVGDGKLLKLVSEEAMSGDVNTDKEVTVLDVVKEQRYLLNADTITWEQFVDADVNRDGSVDVFDLALLKRQVLNNNK